MMSFPSRGKGPRYNYFIDKKKKKAGICLSLPVDDVSLALGNQYEKHMQI